MKTKIIAITCATLAQGYAATNVVLQNTNLPSTGFPIVDNAGVPIDSNNLNLWVGTFDSAFVAGIDSLSIEADDQAVFDAFTPTGTSVIANPAAIAGLFNTSVSDADNGNSLVGQDVYLLVENTAAGATDVIVFNLAATFPEQDATGAGAVPGRVLGLDDVIFGNAGVPVDTSGYPAVIADSGGFNEGIAFNGGVIPEPSTSLLAALAGLGLVARRRR